MLFGSLGPDLLDILEFAARAGLLGNPEWNIILLLEGFKILLTFMFIFIIIIDSIIPIS